MRMMMMMIMNIFIITITIYYHYQSISLSFYLSIMSYHLILMMIRRRMTTRMASCLWLCLLLVWSNYSLLTTLRLFATKSRPETDKGIWYEPNNCLTLGEKGFLYLQMLLEKLETTTLWTCQPIIVKRSMVCWCSGWASRQMLMWSSFPVKTHQRWKPISLPETNSE